jgi:Rrf2 family iron-sulfur cluster assembly transcriptional regulator
MRLSTKGRYAVMALVDLASNSNGRPVALADISARQEISLSYLEQLFAKLRRSGLVKSVRGPGGGYLLARSAEDTRISDAILAVDEPIRATRCKPNSAAGCHSDKSRCLTHDLWEELSHQIQLFLSAVSLADVCNRRVLGKAMPVERADGVASTVPTVSEPAQVTNLKSPTLPATDPTTVAAE